MLRRDFVKSSMVASLTLLLPDTLLHLFPNKMQQIGVQLFSLPKLLSDDFHGGGVDPIAYLDAYPERYHLMYLKDMKEEKTFAGDGGTPDQWMPPFPYITDVGVGVLDARSKQSSHRA